MFHMLFLQHGESVQARGEERGRMADFSVADEPEAATEFSASTRCKKATPEIKVTILAFFPSLLTWPMWQFSF